MSTSTTGPIPRPALRLVRAAPPAAVRGSKILARARFRMARRRRLALLSTFGLACILAVVRIASARAEQRGTGGFDAMLTFAWAALIVMPPFATAVKPRPVRAGALVALVTGPLLMRAVFGAGWGWFEIALAVIACAGALAPTSPLLTASSND